MKSSEQVSQEIAGLCREHFHDEIQDMKDRLRELGGSWGRFAACLNERARQIGVPRKEFQRAAGRTFRQGEVAWKMFLQFHRIGGWPPD